MTTEDLQAIYDRLLATHGHQGWWPAATPFEVAVGAILTQNTSWRNVEAAVAALAAAGALSPLALLAMPEDRLAELIRPARYPGVKAARLRHLVEWLVDRCGGDIHLEALRAAPLDLVALREDLLRVRGVGPETADSILLYALDRPVFVVDAYTRRIAARLGLAPKDASYDELQALFSGALPPDVELYKDFHAQLVRLGHTRCRPRPRCGGCPLEARCGGPP